jgi:hypothetical protein
LRSGEAAEQKHRRSGGGCNRPQFHGGPAERVLSTLSHGELTLKSPSENHRNRRSVI